MARKQKATRAVSTRTRRVSTRAVQFTNDDIEALKLLVGYVLAFDVVRPPYAGEVQSVLTKLGLVQKDSPERHAVSASMRAPVKMQ
jgi:hypothetical protein